MFVTSDDVPHVSFTVSRTDCMWLRGITSKHTQQYHITFRLEKGKRAKWSLNFIKGAKGILNGTGTGRLLALLMFSKAKLSALDFWQHIMKYKSIIRKADALYELIQNTRLIL